MAKSNVFVIWNEYSIADEVKKLIQASDSGYRVFVGGNTRKATSMTLPATVVKELKRCDQAVALIDGRYNSVQNSNVMYELGYAISLYGHKKTSIYLIGCSVDDLPSDLKGLWIDSIIPVESIDDSLEENQKTIIEQMEQSEELSIQKLADLSREECKKRNYYLKAAKKVSDDFLNKDSSFSTPKMKIIVNYYRYRELIIDWVQKPSLFRYTCSEKDMAFFLLFLTQGANFYDDYIDLREAVQSIRRSSTSLCNMLRAAIRYSLNYLDFFLNIKPKSGNPDFHYQLDSHTYYRVLNNLVELKGEFKNSDNNGTDHSEFSQWLVASIDEILPYLTLVRAHSVESMEEKNQLLNMVIEYCKTFINTAEELKKQMEQKQTEELDNSILSLFLAYNYRNLFCAYKALEHKEDAKNALKKSYELRKDLYELFCNKMAIPDIFERNLKMEYYLSWYESKMYLNNEELEENKFHEAIDNEELKRFLEKEQFYDKRMKFYTVKIEDLIKQNEEYVI